MKKLFTAFTFIVCLSLSVSAIDVDLEVEDPNPNPFPEGRSVSAIVTASIESQVLTIQFSEVTSSQVVISNSLTNTTVWSDCYNPAYSVQANLLSLPSGSYTLHIYTYGYGWHGTFAIE